MGSCEWVSRITALYLSLMADSDSYCVRTFSGHTEWVREVVPSEDGRWLVSSSSDQVRASPSAIDQSVDRS